jgi:hypothetical protein
VSARLPGSPGVEEEARVFMRDEFAVPSDGGRERTCVPAPSLREA